MEAFLNKAFKKEEGGSGHYFFQKCWVSGQQVEIKKKKRYFIKICLFEYILQMQQSALRAQIHRTPCSVYLWHVMEDWAETAQHQQHATLF